MVLVAPLIRAKRTSTPTSPSPQKALQKSRERLLNSVDCALANLDKEVDDGCRRADIASLKERSLLCSLVSVRGS